VEQKSYREKGSCSGKTGSHKTAASIRDEMKGITANSGVEADAVRGPAVSRAHGLPRRSPTRWAAGRADSGPGMVVLKRCRRSAPRRPRSFISRATVHRAVGIFFRFSCR
jgi:hypothetical protein